MRAGRVCYGPIAAISTPPGTEHPRALRAARAAGAAAAALLAACFLAQALWQIAGEDPTYDERHTFGTGVRILSGDDWTGSALLHPPLAYVVTALPLLATNPSAGPDDARALLLARLASLLVFSVPLLIAIAAWARSLFGPAAALAAVAAAAFSPTLLAHAPLATPDLALTATGFIAVWLFSRARGRWSAAAWGAALGLALLAKVTGLLFAAVVIVLGLVRVRARPRDALRLLAPGLLVAGLVLHLGYGFEGSLDAAGKAALLERIPGAPARAAASVAAAMLPRPYLHAIGRQSHVALRGWPNYLMGEVSRDGWRHYFLVALALKETLPFLVLLALGGLALRLTRRTREDEAALLLPFLALLAVFSLGRVQIGIRYLLPALPFLFVFASRLAAVGGRWRSPARAATVALLAAHAASTLSAGRDHIAYFNALAGGPRGGYRYLADSNLDWGQGRSRAQRWAAENGAAFDPPAPPERGRVVVSANRLLGLTDAGDRYRGLRESRRPAGWVGANWLVYEVGSGR